MSQEHLDRLTAIDASFLHQEGPTSHMHVGALTEFEGPPPPFTELLDTLRGRTEAGAGVAAAQALFAGPVA